MKTDDWKDSSGQGRPGQGLKKALKLFRARKFPQVVRLLEPQVFRFRDSYEFYYLLGVSCLYTGDVSGAISYLQRAEQLAEEAIDVLTGLAAAHFKRGETDKALRIWLDILDIEPRNRKAKYGLNLLRKGEQSEEYRKLIQSGNITRLFPAPPFSIPFLVPSLAVLTVIVLVSYILITQVLPQRRDPRPGLNAIHLPGGIPSIIEHVSEVRFQFTEKQVVDIFEKAKKYLQNYRDNLALVEINRLLLSNASTRVKEEARMLAAIADQPDFSTITDSFTYEKVSKAPLLYNNCHVVWDGKIANLLISTELISFELLVGYQEEEELLGITQVHLNFAVILENGMAVRVLGKVAAANEEFYLQGVSIQKIYPSEER